MSEGHLGREPLRWTRFYWSDHSYDTGLRCCNLAAQGLWMRLLCIMADAEPYGHLLIDGKVPSDSRVGLAAGLGIRAGRQVRRLMDELRFHGVLSVTDDGVPFCRRMARDIDPRGVSAGGRLDVSQAEWAGLRQQTFERDGFACRYCGAADRPLQCDHVVPLTRGGRSRLDNLVTACQPCNGSKGAKTPEEWGGGRAPV